MIIIITTFIYDLQSSAEFQTLNKHDVGFRWKWFTRNSTPTGWTQCRCMVEPKQYPHSTIQSILPASKDYTILTYTNYIIIENTFLDLSVSRPRSHTIGTSEGFTVRFRWGPSASKAPR